MGFLNKDEQPVQETDSLFEETEEEKEEKFRKPANITLNGEVYPLNTNLGTGLKIERKTKVTLNDYIQNLELMGVDQAVDIISIAANKDTSNFRNLVVNQDDFLMICEVAANVIIGIVFPGDLATAEKKIDDTNMDEITKNELRVRLGLPEKALTGDIY